MDHTYVKEYTHLIPNVAREEYHALKKISEKFLGEINKEKDGMTYPVIKDKGILSLDFKYNPDKKAIGIFVKRGKIEKLVLNNGDISDSEHGEGILAGMLCKMVAENLEDYRIRNGKWI